MSAYKSSPAQPAAQTSSIILNSCIIIHIDDTLASTGTQIPHCLYNYVYDYNYV